MDRVLTLEMHVARYKPLKGAGRFKTPPKLRHKLAVVNVDVDTDDNECFKWAVLSATFNISKNAHRVSKYKKIDHGLDFSKITYPTPLCEIPKFEKSNDISISAFLNSF